MKTEAQTIAESILPTIVWTSPDHGISHCPGKNLHSKPSSARDCAIYLNGAPTISCFHTSCSEIIEQCNLALRQGLSHLSTDSKDRETWLARRQLKTEYENSRVSILRDYAWSPPLRSSHTPLTDQLDLLKLFDPADIIWLGELAHSGPKYGSHFKSAADWINYQTNFGVIKESFICPSSFMAATYSRSKATVVTPRYLVVESDTLPTDDLMAVFNWLRQTLGLKLIIDTGGKSLHGWFEYPGPELFEELKIALTVLGCDPKLFNPAQPVRFPGVERSPNKWQKIIYSNII